MKKFRIVSKIKRKDWTLPEESIFTETFYIERRVLFFWWKRLRSSVDGISSEELEFSFIASARFHLFDSIMRDGHWIKKANEYYFYPRVYSGYG